MEKTYQRLKYFFRYMILGLLGGIILPAVFCVGEAQAQSIRLISDEETEQFLQHIVKPLFEAAGIKFYRNNIFIVEDNSLNAFVADANRLFVHTGTITRADNANEVSGVIAHETGHIMGGHILRQKLKAQDMNTVSLVSAMLAGASAALSGRGDVAMAVMLGGQSSLLNEYMVYRTGEERSADEAAAMLLDKTKQSPAGVLTFMKKISKDNMLNGREEMPYFRTHPITTERIKFFEKKVLESPYSATSPYDKEFERVKAKLKAYLLTPEETLKLYPLTRKDIPARYAQAIAYFKMLKFDEAAKILDELSAIEPNNPYFFELKGQIMLESGNLKRAKDAFAKAYELMPNSQLMQVNYAQVILEDEPSPAEAKKAITLLNKSLVSSPNAFSWMLLAKAYAISGDMAAAAYATAEFSLRTGNLKNAKNQLKQAQKYPRSDNIRIKINDLENRIKLLEKKEL